MLRCIWLAALFATGAQSVTLGRQEVESFPGVVANDGCGSRNESVESASTATLDLQERLAGASTEDTGSASFVNDGFKPLPTGKFHTMDMPSQTLDPQDAQTFVSAEKFYLPYVPPNVSKVPPPPPTKEAPVYVPRFNANVVISTLTSSGTSRSEGILYVDQIDHKLKYAMQPDFAGREVKMLLCNQSKIFRWVERSDKLAEKCEWFPTNCESGKLPVARVAPQAKLLVDTEIIPYNTYNRKRIITDHWQYKQTMTLKGQPLQVISDDWTQMTSDGKSFVPVRVMRTVTRLDQPEVVFKKTISFSNIVVNNASLPNNFAIPKKGGNAVVKDGNGKSKLAALLEKKNMTRTSAPDLLETTVKTCTGPHSWSMLAKTDAQGNRKKFSSEDLKLFEWM